MTAFLGWAIQHPLHSGVIAGIVIAIVFGVISLPNENQITKTVTDWLPPNASQDQDEIDDLIMSLEAARENDATLERVSEDEFRELDLARSYAFPQAGDGGEFTIEYVGQVGGDAGTVYLAEREVEPAPWWHPDRLLYRAVSYQADRFGTGLELTYERDWDRIGALLLLDAVIGAVYGTMIALVLGAFGSRAMEIPGPAYPRQLPAETSVKLFHTGKFEPDAKT